MTQQDAAQAATEQAAKVHEQIRQTLKLFQPSPEDIIEIRSLGIPSGYGRPHDCAGYFSDMGKAVGKIVALDKQNPEGVYVVMNRINPAALARSANELTKWQKITTSDHDIERRLWLLFDADPIRPAGISSSDAELQAARDVTENLRSWLCAMLGWSDPVQAMSGNGMHLLFRIDLPADDESRDLVKAVLDAASAKFTTPAVKIDTTVHNASRITKCYGTTPRKGISSDRPQRRSVIEIVPDDLVPVPVELLQQVAAMVPKPTAQPKGSSSRNGATNHVLDIAKWLAAKGVAFTAKDKPTADGRAIFALLECPFDAQHGKRGECCIMQDSSGKLSAKCQHESCSGNGWKQFKAAIGPPEDDHFDPPKTRKGKKSKQPPKPRSEHDMRTCVEVTLDRHVVNKEVLKVLPSDTSLYQRGGRLVHVVPSVGGQMMGVVRAANVPIITELPVELLGEKLTENIFFCHLGTEDGEEMEEQVNPPLWCIKGIHSRGHYPNIRPLNGVVTTPILRVDGTILETPGYDPGTGLYYDPADAFPSIPAKPTYAMVRDALELVLDIVSEFPFAIEAHRSSWLAALLTPLARFAFAGPSPLFLVDANVRGSGKSLLTDLIALIVLNADMARMANDYDDREMRKRITSIVMLCDRLVLVDNINGTLGCAALDAALTGTIWKDRELGKNRIIEAPLMAVWYATGNNVVLAADTSRRVVHVRIDSKMERPEERTGFKYPDLNRHVREQRAELLTAALTILRGYFVAGCPQQPLKPWGSFEGWSDLIRQAIVWLGLPDPGETREQLVERSDREATALRTMLAGWEEIDPDCHGITAAKVASLLENNPKQYEILRGAVAEICDTKNLARSLGNKLRHLRGRICGGKFFDSKVERTGAALWMVRHAADEVQTLHTPQTLATATRGRKTKKNNGCEKNTYADFESVGEESAKSAESASTHEEPPVDNSWESYKRTSPVYAAHRGTVGSTT